MTRLQVTRKRNIHQIFPNHVVGVWIWEYMSTVTMQGSLLLEYLGPVLWFYWMEHLFIGAPRSKLHVKQVLLVVNYVLWSKLQNMSRVFATSWEWWEFLWKTQPSSLAKTSPCQPKKKTQSIAYHFVREGRARDDWRTAYISKHENVADLLTRPLPSGEKRWKFVGMLLHHLVPQGVLWGDTNGWPECTVKGRSSDIPPLIARNFMGDSVAVFFLF